jgi:hypothetical protein
VWAVVHGAAGAIREAGKELATDDGPAYWYAIGAPGRPDVACASYRGARWRATRYGGRIEQRHPDAVETRTRAAAARVAVAVNEAQVACRVALLIHPLMALLAETGAIDYRPEREVCGQVGGRVHLEGLHWICGAVNEPTSPVPIAAVEAFIAHGVAGLRAALAQIDTACAFGLPTDAEIEISCNA